MDDQTVLPFSMSGSVCQEIETSMSYFCKMVEKIINSGRVPTPDFPDYCQTNIAVSCQEMNTSFYSVKCYTESYNLEAGHELETLTLQMGISEVELSLTEKNLKQIELNISQCDKEIAEAKTQKQEAEKSIAEIERKITDLDKQKENSSRNQVFTFGATVVSGFFFPPSLWLTVPAAALTIGVIESEKSKLSEQLSFQRSEKEYRDKNLKQKQKEIENLKKEQKDCSQKLTEAKEKINRTANEIAKVKEQINKATDLLGKIRRVCTSVDSVSGAMNVIKRETINAYAFGPLIFPLKELFKYLQDLINTFPVESRIQMIQTLREIQVMTTKIQCIEPPHSDFSDSF